MPGVGLEPTRPLSQRLLRPPRLPVPPPRRAPQMPHKNRAARPGFRVLQKQITQSLTQCASQIVYYPHDVGT